MHCRGDTDYGSSELPLLRHVQELSAKLGFPKPFEQLPDLCETSERFGADYCPDASDLAEALAQVASAQGNADEPLDEVLEDQALSSATWDDVGMFLDSGEAIYMASCQELKHLNGSR